MTAQWAARSGPLRLTAGLLLFGLIALFAVRQWAASGEAFPVQRQAIAALLGEPRLLRQRLLLDSAAAAHSGSGLTGDVRSRLERVAVARPLAVEPFLLAGASAQLGGDHAAAERLYLAARLRDPRSPAARYLLADHYLRQGRAREALRETASLFRLAPQAAEPLAKALADFVRQPGGAAQLEPIVRGDPRIAEAVLGILAADARNAPVMLAIAPRRAPGAALASYEQRLLDSLVSSGEVRRAEALWRRWTGRQREGAVVNPRFDQRRAVPPFDWAVYSGPAGAVEFAAGGGMTAVHYGREPMIAVRQLLLLGPGGHRLDSRAAAAASGRDRYRWKISCTDGRSIAQTAVGAAAATFAVPADCQAQWLDLVADVDEGSQSSEVRVSSVAIVRSER